MSVKTSVCAITIAVATSGFTAQTSLAQGHIAGGAVDAVAAGKHHRVAGVVVGGAIGHYMAKIKAKKQGAAEPK